MDYLFYHAPYRFLNYNVGVKHQLRVQIICLLATVGMILQKSLQAKIQENK